MNSTGKKEVWKTVAGKSLGGENAIGGMETENF